MLIILFLVSHSNFLFVPCGRPSWLPVSFLLHVKYPLSYRIVSYPSEPLVLIYRDVRSIYFYFRSVSVRFLKNSDSVRNEFCSVRFEY